MIRRRFKPPDFFLFMIKKIIGPVVGVVLFLLTLAGLFYLFEANTKTKISKNPVARGAQYRFIEKNDQGHFPEHHTFGFAPDSLIEASLSNENGLIYKVQYQTDHWGLRAVKDAHPGKGKKHAIFGGCSFTFGQGLKDEDTLPYLIEESHPEVNTVNFTFLGGAVHTLLYHAKLVPLKAYVKEKEGKFFYIFINDHLNRFLGRADYLAWANPLYPHYEIESGKAVFKGLLKDQPFHQAFKKAEASGLKNTALHLTSIYKNKNEFTDDELNAFLTAVKELERVYKSDFPKGKFYFIMHPHHGLAREHTKKFLQIAQEKQIHVLDLDPIFQKFISDHKPDVSTYEIKGDGHPSAKMNRYIKGILEERYFK